MQNSSELFHGHALRLHAERSHLSHPAAAGGFDAGADAVKRKIKAEDALSGWEGRLLLF